MFRYCLAFSAPALAAAITLALTGHPAAQENKPDAAGGGKSLTVASWGGAYAQSQARAYFKPFEKETGIRIEAVSHGGNFNALEKTGGSGGSWDVVDLGTATLERACREGNLEPIDAGALAAAVGTVSPRDDFLPGALHECGVASVAWSAAIVYDKRAFGKRAPKSVSDLFDVKRFPGKRALPRGPKYTLELALMADGVKPEDVYGELETEAGIERAFAVLEKIRDDIVWWRGAHEPLRLLAVKAVSMSVAFNGRIFAAIAGENRPFGIIWHGQIYDLDLWAIPKSAPDKDAALKFISFATSPERLAAQARLFPYGPMRKSAIAMIGKHAEIDVDMAGFIPTAGGNMETALQLDTKWWSGREENLKKRFETWLEGSTAAGTAGAEKDAANREKEDSGAR